MSRRTKEPEATYAVIDGIRYRTGWIPGRLDCDCGANIEMSQSPGEDFSCDHCHTLYNSAGQRLADPSQWGEETGESAMDYYQGFYGLD